MYINKLYKKNRLKKDTNINNEKIINFVWLLRIISKLFTGKKPPDEIKDIDKFKEIYDRKSNILRIIYITIVRNE